MVLGYAAPKGYETDILKSVNVVRFILRVEFILLHLYLYGAIGNNQQFKLLYTSYYINTVT